MEKKQNKLLWKEMVSQFCGNITFHPSWWHKQCGIAFDEPFWNDSTYRLEADCLMRKYLYETFGAYGMGEKNPKPRPILGTDLLASGYLFSAMAGCDILFGTEIPPQVLPANMTIEQIKGLSVEKTLSSKWWQEVRRQAEILKSKYGHVISCINLQGVQNLAMDLRGSELLLDYYEEPELAEELLSFCTELLQKTGKELQSFSPYLSGGVTAIAKQVFPKGYVHSNCTVEMISNDCYEAFLLPAERKLSEAFLSSGIPYGIHHCGQSMEHVCGGYSKVKNLSFAEVGAGSDIKKVRNQLGEDIWLNLRYSPVLLMQADEDKLREEIEEMVRLAGGKNRLSISCVGIDASVPAEQCACFMNVCKEVFFDFKSQ